MARKLLEALGHPMAKPVEPEEGPYVERTIPFDEMEHDIVWNPHENTSDEEFQAYDMAFDNDEDAHSLETLYPEDNLSDSDSEDYSSKPDIPYEDMENSIPQNPYTNISDDEFSATSEAFEKEMTVSPVKEANEADQLEDALIDNDILSVVMPQNPDAISTEGLTAKKSTPKDKEKSYVDNGTTPMRIAERFLAKNSMFKLNGGRMYLYGYKNKPCYTEITEEELCDTLFREYKNHFMNDSPGQVVQVAKAVRIQLELTSNDTIREFESRYVACRNVIIDLERNCVIRHTPGILLRYYLEVDVDLNNSDCPKFDRFLNDMSCGKAEVITAMQQMIAYSVFPTAFKKAFFVMIGPPNSSKSVLGNFIQSLFCQGAVCNESLQNLGKNFRSGNYAEARLNFDGDLPNQPIGESEAGILKKILGGERIMAEKKYQQSYTTETDCKFLFASNHKLILKSSDDAFLYRMHVIPCDNVIEAGEMDLQLSEKLQRETTAIFTRIYHWYRELKANNYRFDDCVNVGEYCKAYVKPEASYISSALDEFIDDCFEITGKEADFVSSETIVRLFKGYCKKNMIANKMPGFTQQFSQFVKENYSDSIRAARRGKDKSRGYAGIICVDPAVYCDDFA